MTTPAFSLPSNTQFNGKLVEHYRLKNKQGAQIGILNYGAIITDIMMPNAHGNIVNCVLGYSTFEEYKNDTHFIGVVAGRYCNRIANSAFELNGQMFSLTANEDNNQLHGGDGFSNKVWSVIDASEQKIVLRLISEDGDQGFPGKLTAKVTYELTDENELVFSWEATTDKDTVISLTQHSYFNIDQSNTVEHCDLNIALSHITPIDDKGIPSGKIESVKKEALSVFDFTKTKSLKEYVNTLPEALSTTKGLDHNFCYAQNTWKDNPQKNQKLATLSSPKSGILMEVYSTLPGLQCYTGNHLGLIDTFNAYQAVCLETQFYPNSPNEPSFPSTTLRAGEITCHTTRYSFSKL